MVLFALFSLTSCRVIPLVIFYLLTPNLQIMDHLIDIALFLWILCSFWRVSLVSWKQRTEFPLFSLSFYAYVPPGRHQHQQAEIKILSRKRALLRNEVDKLAASLFWRPDKNKQVEGGGMSRLPVIWAQT